MPHIALPVSRRRVLFTALSMVASAGLAGCAVSVPAHIQPISGFDAAKYAGTWYEIARIEQWFEKDLIQTSAQYTLQSNGSLQVINRGFHPEQQEWKESVGTARFLGDSRVAALKVSFFGPFYGGYNVVSLDADYQVALVVGHSTDYFWLLSRKQHLPQAEIYQLLQKAQAMGVDLNKVLLVKQQ